MSSLLRNFASSAASQAFSVIGTETLTIGAATYAVVGAEHTKEHDTESAGYLEPQGLTVTLKAADDPGASCVGRIATIRGRQFRVERYSGGLDFVTLTLSEKEARR